MIKLKPGRSLAVAALILATAARAAPAKNPPQIMETRISARQISLAVANADGSGERPFLKTGGYDYDPAWSPDGRWVAFTSERDGLAQLYRAHPDGTALARLTDDAVYHDQATFSPDSRRLVYVSTRGGGFANLWTLDLETRKSHRVTSGTWGDFRPSWSPDGQWIAFASDRGSDFPHAAGRWERLQLADVYLVHPDGTGLRRLTAHGNFCGSPKWRRDGKSLLAYCMDAQTTLAVRVGPEVETKLVSIDAATGASTPLSAGPGQKAAPTPLPGGGFGYVRLAPQAPGIFYDQGRPGPKGLIRTASWSPDGKQVVFERPVAALPDLSTSLGGSNPDYRLRFSTMSSFDASGSRYVAAASNGQIAGALQVVDRATGKARPLFNKKDVSALQPQWAKKTDTIFFGLGQFRLFQAGFETKVEKSADRVDGGAHIASIRPDSSGFQQLTFGEGANDGGPSPSPDGRRIVYRTFGPAGSGLRILDLKTKAVTALTSTYDNFPFWSPRGDLIMFSRQLGKDVVGGDYEVFTIHPDGTGLKQLTFTKGNDAHMGWSPDGEWIVFASSRKGFKDEVIYTFAPQPYGELFVMRYDGTAVRQLTDNQWEDGAPTWAPELTRPRY